MGPELAIVAFVALQRLAELVWSRRNTARLVAEGGIEVGAGHYPLIVALHAAWFIALVMVAAQDDAPIHLPFLGLYGVLLALRLWVMASLGRYWTTRIITVPGAPLIKRGPYRYMRHPNYAVVVGEVAVVPLIFGAWEVALAFSALNLALLRHRIAVEDAALAGRRSERVAAKP
jgi:methyltransferase